MSDEITFRYPQTGAEVEYVADDPQAMAFVPTEPITDLDTAADVLIELLERRLQAVVDTHPGPPGLMLSGGIDSILAAAVCARIGIRPHAVTVVTDGGADQPPDDLRGVAVARHFDFAHDLLTLNPELITEAATRCIDKLGTWEVWEVTSAIPNRAAFDRFEALGTGPVFTGAGSDALFMGGSQLQNDPADPAGLDEFRDTVTTKVHANFTRARLIPDYYERLLGENSRNFVQVYQTEGFWRLAMSIHPQLLWQPGPDGRVYDKYLLRYAAGRIGVPAEFIWTRKAPLQVSSGVVGALGHAARVALARAPHQDTYTDPLVEPIEFTAVRLYLNRLSGIAL